MIINPPLAIYKHLAAFSFMLAGMFADLLVVRLCLTSAYIFLIANGLLGSPLWPHLYRPGHLTVDMLLWGFACLYVHVSSVVRLLADEGAVPLTTTPQEEALWRMFYRVGGLSRQLFRHYIAAHLQVVTAARRRRTSARRAMDVHRPTAAGGAWTLHGIREFARVCRRRNAFGDARNPVGCGGRLHTQRFASETNLD